MRRFLNGIFVGSLVGVMMGLLANGNMKPQRKRIFGRTKRIGDNASRMVEDVTKGVTKMMRKR